MEVICWTISSLTDDCENGWRESLRGRLGVRWSIVISIMSFIEVSIPWARYIYFRKLICASSSQNRGYYDLTNGQYQDY